MRKKVSTLLDEGLYRKAKLEAAMKGKQISEILGEALEEYLNAQAPGGRSIATATWNSVAVERDALDEIMADEDWIDA